MPLLLTILSVLAFWTFLSVLVFGLLLVLKALQGIRGSLERIAMGVRAIEHEVAPLGPRSRATATALGEARDGVRSAAHGFAGMAEQLAAAAPVLDARSR